jgi:hypothetical protein
VGEQVLATGGVRPPVIAEDDEVARCVGHGAPWLGRGLLRRASVAQPPETSAGRRGDLTAAPRRFGQPVATPRAVRWNILMDGGLAAEFPLSGAGNRGRIFAEVGGMP